MKTKKLLGYFGVLILGSIITVVIDQLVGVSFADVNVVAQITHKATYMVWGGVLLGMNKWLEN